MRNVAFLFICFFASSCYSQDGVINICDSVLGSYFLKDGKMCFLDIPVEPLYTVFKVSSVEEGLEIIEEATASSTGSFLYPDFLDTHGYLGIFEIQKNSAFETYAIVFDYSKYNSYNGDMYVGSAFRYAMINECSERFGTSDIMVPANYFGSSVYMSDIEPSDLGGGEDVTEYQSQVLTYLQEMESLFTVSCDYFSIFVFSQGLMLGAFFYIAFMQRR
ncbi:MAG: hypothetical protein Q4C70_05280 [Planctomycetia bacterium]|nr:hypothetical protein [Planctomycetia bacterium]